MSAPLVTVDDAKSAAKSLFGLEGKVTGLGSCQDANFKLITDSNAYFVVKFSNKSTDIKEIEFQNSLLQHVENIPTTLQFPIVQKLQDNSGYIGQYCTANDTYHVRVLSFVKGSLLCDFKFLNDDVLVAFGKFVATIVKMLSSYTGTVSTIETQWNARKATTTVLELSSSIVDINERNRIVSTANELNNEIIQYQSQFREQVLHGDLAYYNVIATRMENGRPQVSGVIDFGDATKSWVVYELAVAITPLMIQSNKPCYLIACDMLRGYLQEGTLNREEILALWPFVVLRSLVNYVSISHQLIQDPSNQYCIDELVLNKQIIENCMHIPMYLAQEAMLITAGLESSEHVKGVARAVRDVLKAGHAIIKHQNIEVIDLSVTSELYSEGDWLSSQKSISQSMLSTTDSMQIIPYGVPILSHTTIRSHGVPNTIPLFTMVSCVEGTELYAPCDGTIEVVVSKHDQYRELLLFVSIDKHLSFIVDGLNAVNNVTQRRILQGSVMTTTSKGCLSVQILPFGFDPSAISFSHNSHNQWSIDQLPPQYCNERDWLYWRNVCPDPTKLLFGHENTHIYEQYAERVVDTNTTALSTRLKYFANVQEHYFKVPPVIERGYKQFLYDRYGRGYLDMVNNVAVLGHCHSAVINATMKQLKLLNTNSRFIYDLLGKFTSKIISKIPQEITAQDKLNVVFLVNSGSEATDLALRIARSVVTQRRRKQAEGGKETSEKAFQLNRDVICLEGAYHGVTTASDEVSTTLNDNPNSLETRAPWVHLVPMPNLYRGPYQVESYGRKSDIGSDSKDEDEQIAEVTEKYIDFVHEKVKYLQAKDTPPAVFIAEPLSGNAGGVELPPGYLAGVYETIRAAGGLCICDEVQVGYGRLGTNFWGFQEHGVVPDIITMAKAAGNGHPLGFVVTSREIAAEFGRAEGSFFSSAGGGPVSCAVGLAVLDTIENESLQQNAFEVGEYLNSKLKDLQLKYPHIVGCIHGHGLYQGVELIKQDTKLGTKLPATMEAYAICERLLELGVICHNTGDYSNVLKVKPPLCFSKEDADFFVNALDVTFNMGW